MENQLLRKQILLDKLLSDLRTERRSLYYGNIDHENNKSDLIALQLGRIKAIEQQINVVESEIKELEASKEINITTPTEQINITVPENQLLKTIEFLIERSYNLHAMAIPKKVTDNIMLELELYLIDTLAGKP